MKAWIKRAGSMTVPGEEVFVTKIDTETLRKTSTAAQMAANAKPKEEKTWDQIVPPHLSRRPAHSTYLRLTHKPWASYGHALGLSDWRLVSGFDCVGTPE